MFKVAFFFSMCGISFGLGPDGVQDNDPQTERCLETRRTGRGRSVDECDDDDTRDYEIGPVINGWEENKFIFYVFRFSWFHF